MILVGPGDLVVLKTRRGSYLPWLAGDRWGEPVTGGQTMVIVEVSGDEGGRARLVLPAGSVGWLPIAVLRRA